MTECSFSASAAAALKVAFLEVGTDGSTTGHSSSSVAALSWLGCCLFAAGAPLDLTAAVTEPALRLSESVYELLHEFIWQRELEPSWNLHFTGSYTPSSLSSSISVVVERLGVRGGQVPSGDGIDGECGVRIRLREGVRMERAVGESGSSTGCCPRSWIRLAIFCGEWMLGRGRRMVLARGVSLMGGSVS